ncbi:hypothetical protein [Halorientalis sp. IM1011]|nr:hypothetical protein [Halorientalis sp. IM1011]
MGTVVLDRLRRFTREHGEYECQRCGQRYEAQRQVCADCGGFSIEREW